MKYITLKLLSKPVVSAVVLSMLIGLPAMAQLLPTIGTDTGQGQASWVGPTLSIPELLTNAGNWAIGIVSFVALVIIVIAGFLWATAGGDEDKIKTARQWITGAVVGIIIALMAWVIVRVVLIYFFQAEA